MSKNKRQLLELKIAIMLLLVGFLVTNTHLLFDSLFIKGELNIKNYTPLTNKTFIGSNPDPKTLIEAYSNGAYLSSYTAPQNTTLIISEGNWTMQKLSEIYPDAVEKITTPNAQRVYLVEKSIDIERNASLDIIKSTVLLKSLPKKDNSPVVLITHGNTNIINSSIMSWDSQNKRPDPNPYHPRPFLVAKNGGQMNIIGSNISYLGFSLAGAHTLVSSLAALAYYNTSQFIIVNSTLSNNLYGFYSEDSSKFKIINNEVFANVKYGLDPHSGSNDLIIDSNHIFANGGQGIICSFKCNNITVTNNSVEYNIEGIGLHWFTNASIVKNNIIKYNKGFGIYIKNNSYSNILMNNTILGNGKGIGLLDNSNENIITYNILAGNILEKDQIHEDNDSQTNIVKNNTYYID